MLSKKFIPLIFLGIFIIAVLQWTLSGFGHFLSRYMFSYAPSYEGTSYAKLAAINFSFFKDGNWRTYISQGYGRTSLSYLYIDGRHNGIDIPAKFGAPVSAPVSGVVIATGNQDTYCYRKGYGKFVVLKSETDAYTLLFAHLSSIAVTVGASLKKGDKIGAVGDTGLVTAPHLHFSVFESQGFAMPAKNGCGPDPSGQDIDPSPYLRDLELK